MVNPLSLNQAIGEMIASGGTDEQARTELAEFAKTMTTQRFRIAVEIGDGDRIIEMGDRDQSSGGGFYELTKANDALYITNYTDDKETGVYKWIARKSIVVWKTKS